MQLYLDSFGAYLGVKNKMFWVNSKVNEEAVFAVRNINAILLTKGVSISVDAMLLALQHDIPIVLLDGIGHPVGQVWSGYYGSISTIRKNQAAFVRSRAGWVWMRDVLLEKVNNQRSFLEKINDNQTGNAIFKRKLRNASLGISEILTKLKRWEFSESELPAETFRGWEGTASRYYWACLSAALPTGWQFKGRSYRPAEDEFNALLNYLYGVLYVQVELALMKAGVDPTMGILHADRNSRPTLVYDVIERYRHWVDEVAYAICNENVIASSAFKQVEVKGFLIGDSAIKAVIIARFLSFLETKIEYNGHLRKRNTHIVLDAQRLATILKGFE